MAYNNEYIVHGTYEKNIIRILKKNELEAEPPAKYKTMLINSKPKQIFTQLLYKDIPNQHRYIPHWGSIAIIFSTKLLQDYPFYSVPVGGFKSSFSRAFRAKHSAKHSKTLTNKSNNTANTANTANTTNNIIIKSEFGNLPRMPNLTKLKNYINKTCLTYSSFMGKIAYMHSHEILFNNDIPLDKYCVAIIGNPGVKQSAELAQLCKDHNIPYSERSGRIGSGINNFINFIDKVKEKEKEKEKEKSAL